jgi:hypothetical protein
MRARRILLALVLALMAASASPAAGSTGGDPLAKQWPHWPYEASCDLTTPFISFDPVAVFAGPAKAESGALPAKTGLREFLAEPSNQLPPTGWRFLGQNLASAEFAHGRLPSDLILVSARRIDGPWSFTPEYGACTPTSVVGSRLATPWRLVRGESLDATTRRVRLRLEAPECTGWRSLNAHTHVAFRQIDRASLLMTTWTDRPPPGQHSCLKLRERPLSVTLPTVLGKRKLLDGGTYPPRPALQTP